MKLLFDQNLSPRLVELLSDLYPNSTHVSLAGLHRALDEAVWAYALENGYTIVTKNADLGELSQARGHPPKVVWLRLGNGTTYQIEAVLRARRSRPWIPTRTSGFLRCSNHPDNESNWLEGAMLCGVHAMVAPAFFSL